MDNQKFIDIASDYYAKFGEFLTPHYEIIGYVTQYELMELGKSAIQNDKKIVWKL